MPEQDWRPSDAAERAHERSLIRWYEEPLGPPASITTPLEADVFTSEEAIRFDRGVVEQYDAARNAWVPTLEQEAAPDQEAGAEERYDQGL